MNDLPVRVRGWSVRLKKIIGTLPDIEADGNQWTLTVPPDKLPPDSTLALVFTCRRRKRMVIDIDLVLNGEKQNVRNLAEALGLLAQAKAESRSKIANERETTRSNSVETRRATVMRN